MNQLDRLEEMAQRLIEGAFNRFFQSDSNNQLASLKNKERSVETKEVLSLASGNKIAKQWGLQLEDRQIALGEPVITLGRALNNDIILNDPTVSRYHAQLRWRNGQYFLYPPDLLLDKAQTRQPLQHTTINDMAVAEEPHPLVAGDILEFGKIRVEIFKFLSQR